MHATPSQLLPELKVLEAYGGARGELHTGYLSNVLQESWGHYLCSEEYSLGEESQAFEGECWAEAPGRGVPQLGTTRPSLPVTVITSDTCLQGPQP